MAFIARSPLTQSFSATVENARRWSNGRLEIRPIDMGAYFDETNQGRSFKPGSGKSFGWDLSDGVPVRREDVPTRIRLQETKENLPCIFVCGGPQAVCEQFRDIVQKLEPNVHQFFPADVVDHQGRIVARQWMFNICNRLDSVDENKSDIVWYARESAKSAEIKPVVSKPESGSGFATYDYFGKLFVRRKSFEGCHFWIDKWLVMGGGKFFCSNEARSAIKSAKLQLIDFVPIDEI